MIVLEVSLVVVNGFQGVHLVPVSQTALQRYKLKSGRFVFGQVEVADA